MPELFCPNCGRKSEQQVLDFCRQIRDGLKAATILSKSHFGRDDLRGLMCNGKFTENESDNIVYAINLAGVKGLFAEDL